MRGTFLHQMGKCSSLLLEKLIPHIIQIFIRNKEQILKQIRRITRPDKIRNIDTFSACMSPSKAFNLHSSLEIPESDLIFSYPPLAFNECDHKSSIWNQIAQCASITSKQPPKGLDLKAMLVKRKNEQERYNKIIESFTKGK